MTEDGGRPAADERVEVTPAEWRAAVEALRAEGFTFFDWLTAVDETDREDDPGFDLVCHLIDIRTPKALRHRLIRARLPEGSTVDSLTELFPGAAWHERETHEMFGIEFDGFDDGTGLGLRPLLLPDGFEGTPLRKSFVLAARASKPWPGAKEPGESGDVHARPTGRRRVSAPGIPDPQWGPR
jgi:NADH-quinone oxidoreductase subunit C